jgi:hypothetical protein
VCLLLLAHIVCLLLAARIVCLLLAAHIVCLLLAARIVCLLLAARNVCLLLSTHIVCLLLSAHIVCLPLAAHISNVNVRLDESKFKKKMFLDIQKPRNEATLVYRIRLPQQYEYNIFIVLCNSVFHPHFTAIIR